MEQGVWRSRFAAMTTLSKPVARVTREPFFSWGADRDRRFVAILEPVDVLTIRPLRSRREAAKITIKLCDVYRYALLCRANMKWLEKANAAKKKKTEARQARKWRRELAKEIAL